MTSAKTLLKYANVQMAAEALLDRIPEVDFATALKDGNTRSSRFTAVQAAEFVQIWQVVEHQSNTTTGFSGTLFQVRQDAPTGLLTQYGLTQAEQVLSFRSTEFADDAARDNQATNVLEIKEYGWAFGQISDMKVWYEQLVTTNKIPAGAPITVTGYSLGGHPPERHLHRRGRRRCTYLQRHPG